MVQLKAHKTGDIHISSAKNRVRKRQLGLRGAATRSVGDSWLSSEPKVCGHQTAQLNLRMLRRMEQEAFLKRSALHPLLCIARRAFAGCEQLHNYGASASCFRDGWGRLHSVDHLVPLCGGTFLSGLGAEWGSSAPLCAEGC